jgi:hypothetical protein
MGNLLDSEPLGMLLSDVLSARRALTTARGRAAAPGPSALIGARHDLVTALVAYTDGLLDEGVPVPYRLRDELRLHRGLDLPRLPPG